MSTAEKQTKAAINQSLFRDVNERVSEMSDGGIPEGEKIGFLCECADTGCTETIELTREEYEAARRVPTHFPIALGHEWGEVERVVERYDRYEVVEKFGQSGKVAVEKWRHGDADSANLS